MMGSQGNGGEADLGLCPTALCCKILNGECASASGRNKQELGGAQVSMYTSTETQRVKCVQHPQYRTRPCSPKPKLPKRSCIARSDIGVETIAYIMQWNEMQLVAKSSIKVRSV